METFTRLDDNQVLNISDKTTLLSAEGAYGVSKHREFSAGIFGKAVPLNSTIEQKIFTLAFVSGDFSGADLKKIDRFFVLSNGLFRMTAPATMGIEYIDFYVNATDYEIFDGKNSIVLTCTALYGDFIEEQIATIYEGTIEAGGNFLSTTIPYVNNFTEQVSVRFSLTAETPLTWQPDISITLRKGTSQQSTAPQVSTRSGLNNEQGTPGQFTGLKYAIDSWEGIVDGNGIINPGSTEFWKVKPGESINVYVDAFSKPIVQSQILTVKYEAILIKQKTVL